MLSSFVHNVTAILSDEDIQKYAGNGFVDFISAALLYDPVAGVSALKNVTDIMFHIPNVLFWDKVKRFLFGTFDSFEDQVKMAQRFSADNDEYEKYVKKLIHLLNSIDDDLKIDYFASLTRCFLLTQLEKQLYYKLANFIRICTPDELYFLATVPYDYQDRNTAMVSSLYQYGLFTQSSNNTSSQYILSDFAKALKENCLNFNNGRTGTIRHTSYESIEPLSLPEAMTADDLGEIFSNSNIILDGGSF